MPTLIEQRFAKPPPLVRSDVETILVRAEEDESLEAKRIPADTSEGEREGLNQRDRQISRRWDIEELAVSAVVGFLNKDDPSGGLLVLGARAPDGVIDGFDPVPNERLDRIEAAVKRKVSSSSHPLTPCRLTSLRVPWTSHASVELIEVHPEDQLVVYYSTISGHAYRREGGKTITLSLPDSLRLAETRRVAKVFVEIVSSTLNTSQLSEDLVVKLRLINRGNAPGRYICTIIHVGGLPDLSKVVLNGPGIKDESRNNPARGRTFSNTVGYPPSSTLAYPGVGIVIGELRIPDFRQNFEVILMVQTYEDKGVSTQRIRLQRSGESIVTASPAEESYTVY